MESGREGEGKDTQASALYTVALCRMLTLPALIIFWGQGQLARKENSKSKEKDYILKYPAALRIHSSAPLVVVEVRVMICMKMRRGCL